MMAQTFSERGGTASCSTRTAFCPLSGLKTGLFCRTLHLRIEGMDEANDSAG